MTSIARRLTRAANRRNGVAPVRRPQLIEVFASGGYRALHPTRGWRYVSAARAALFGLKPATAQDIALNGV